MPQPERRPQPNDPVSSAAGAYGTMIGTQMAAGIPASLLSAKLIEQLREGHDPDIARHLMRGAPEGVGIRDVDKALGDAKGFRRDVMKKQMEMAGPAYYPKTKSVINADSVNPAVLSHELGHARTHKVLGKAYAPLRMGAGLAMGMALPVGAYKYLRYRKSDPERAEKARRTAMGVSGVGGAAILADEAAASVQGLRQLKKLKAANPKLNINMGKSRGLLMRAGATYGLAAAAPMLGLWGLKKLAPPRQVEKEASVLSRDLASERWELAVFPSAITAGTGIALIW